LQRIDLAVMRDVAVRMRQLPTGESVGREALVNQTERAHGLGIGEVAVEICDLRRQQQAFVDDRPTRERGDIEEFLVLNIRLADLLFRALANHIELALEGVFVHFQWTSYKNLLNVRLRVSRHAADGIAVDGCVTPAQNAQAFLANNAFENAFTVQARCFLDRQEGHADGILTRLRQSDAQQPAFTRKEFVRNLYEHAGAVAGFRITAAGAAMGEVDKDLNSLLDDLMGLLAANAGDEAHAASIVLEARIVKTLRRRETVICLPVLQMAP